MWKETVIPEYISLLQYVPGRTVEYHENQQNSGCHDRFKMEPPVQEEVNM
jgi:hypothetical protein